jgi:hypothetical protein
MAIRADSHHLDSEQRRTLEQLSAYPLSHNLKWPKVLHLLEALGDVVVESKERHFLVSSTDTTDERSRGGRVLLLVLDRRAAIVYELEPFTEHQATIKVYDPRGRLRHLRHLAGHDQGRRTPEEVTYYQAIARAIEGANTVVIFGHGDGTANAAKTLEDRIRSHLLNANPKLFVEVRLDAGSYTEAQLLAAAYELVNTSRRSAEIIDR